jgi:septum formation protein
MLSGGRHRVIGGLALVLPDGRLLSRAVVTQVAFKPLGHEEVRAYLASGEWHGKAGGYAIQGLAAAYVKWVEGSYSNVVGLPLFETNALLRGNGYLTNPEITP